MTNTERGAETLQNGLSESAAKMGEMVGDVASQTKERMEYLAQKADKILRGTAEALQDTADSIRSCVGASGDAITNVANNTSEKLESTAIYVRSHGFRGMMGDLGQVVRRNPAPSLLAALGMGLFLGSALFGRKSD